jgi:enterochelin esterase-like enzyme
VIPVGRFRTFEVSDPALEVEGLRHVTVHSPALGSRADLTVWVPDAPGPLPIVILLHGVYGSHWLWAHKAGVHRTAARLLAEGAIPPMVLAMPSDGMWEDGSGYLALPDRDAETWVVDEVVEAVTAAVPQARATAGLCLAGLSMGGFGALRLGARHPGRFRAVAGHSSITRLCQLREMTATPLEDVGDLGELLIEHRDCLPAIRFDCGLDDAFLGANRRLHEQLSQVDVPHIYQEHPGGHDWDYWAEHIAQTLVFFGQQLSLRTLGRSTESLPDGRRITYYAEHHDE